MTGSNVRYRLMSLWPINPDNSPYSESEKKGLEAVTRDPERSATATVKEGESDVLPSHLCRSCRH
jgi:hypothetical protein